jgi:dihydroorotase
MGKLLVKGGRIIDPANGIDEVWDLLMENGKVVAIEAGIDVDDATIYDATGKWVTPGLIDIHTHLREPGHEYKETIHTGAESAAAGGFTGIACMANTNPVNDNAQITEYIQKAAATAPVNVYVIGAITKGLKGAELAEIGEMKKLGIVAISDDGKCVTDGAVMRAGMEYAAMFGLPVIEHAEDHTLNKGGVMNEGIVSEELGLIGFPTVAEDDIVARDILLAEYLGSHVHIAHVSTKGAVELIRWGKSKGVNVTGEASPHHFTLTDDCCRGYNTNAKMAPPLRTSADIAAIKAGLADGTLDCIATDHAPHAVHEKEVEFDQAAFGIVGLETALGLSLALVREEVLTPSQLITAMSYNPAKIINVDRGTLRVGAVADVTIIDPDLKWTVDVNRFKSKSKNTPFNGWELQGRAAATIVNGAIVFEMEA